MPTLTHACVCRVRFGNFTNGDEKQMAKLVSRAGAGCIAAMDQNNPRISTYGIEPWLGVQLTVNWGKLISMETNPSIRLLPLSHIGVHGC